MSAASLIKTPGLETPTIETARLCLRDVVSGDGPAFRAARQGDSVTTPESPIRPWSAPTSPEAEALAETLRALIPRLDTPRLTLRAPQKFDFAAWAEVLCTARAEHIGGPVSEDQAWFDFCLNTANWFLRGHGMWTVEATKSADRAGEVLGFILIGFEPGDREPELGYLFRQNAGGQGFATEAALAARDFALNRLRLPTLVSYIAPENARSLALARRLGATPEGSIDGCEIWRQHPKGTP